jgi:hypothetical protein
MTEEKEKPPIHLKMKVGNVEFEIDCREDQLEDAVARILSSVTEYAKEAVVISERAVPSARAETCKGVITRLWQEGWFATRRSLGNVHSEMARRGFHYDRTAVAHALIDLVKDNILTRDGKPRRYRYAQKRPPTIK